MTWLPAFGFDVCVLTLWFVLDWAERRGQLEKFFTQLSGEQRVAWYLTDGAITTAVQEGELAMMARQGYYRMRTASLSGWVRRNYEGRRIDR